jgi:tripartite-type tricarboxylate transporter receptor subunit TctC
MIVSTGLFAKTDLVRIVVPYPPGGPADQSGRFVQDAINANSKMTAIVENMPGANGNIGTAFVANSDPKHAIFLVNNVGLPVNAIIKPSAYNTDQLVPVMSLGRIPIVLVSSRKFYDGMPGKQWRNIDPGTRITYASSGVGTGSNFFGESLKQVSNKNLVHVPYRTGVLAVPDVVNNDVNVLVLFLPQALPFIKDGKLVPIAVEANNRLPEIPDTPTFKELGYNGLAGHDWFMLFSNQTTDTDKIEAVKKIFNQYVKNPKVVNSLQNTRQFDRNIFPPANFINTEKDKYRKLIKDNNLTFD